MVLRVFDFWNFQLVLASRGSPTLHPSSLKMMPRGTAIGGLGQLVCPQGLPSTEGGGRGGRFLAIRVCLLVKFFMALEDAILKPEVFCLGWLAPMLYIMSFCERPLNLKPQSKGISSSIIGFTDRRRWRLGASKCASVRDSVGGMGGWLSSRVW